MSGRRLNVNLPESAFEELRRLGEASNRSMTEVIRTGLGLAKLAMEEEAKGRRLAVIDRDGEVIKIVVLPL